MINGGLGLQLAGNVRRRTYVAYGVVAGVIWLLWVLASAFGSWKRRRNVPATTRRTKATSSNGSSPVRDGGIPQRNRAARQADIEEDKGPTYA